MPSAVPIAFKQALLAGRQWKAALYVGAANLGNGTLGYVTANEVVGAGYAAGGILLVPTVTVGSDGTTALLDFEDISWTGASFTARYILIYDNNLAGKEGLVIDLGIDKTVSAGTLEVRWPAPDLLTAIAQAA